MIWFDYVNDPECALVAHEEGGQPEGHTIVLGATDGTFIYGIEKPDDSTQYTLVVNIGFFTVAGFTFDTIEEAKAEAERIASNG